MEQCNAGPVWTTLYILCGISSWLVWTHRGFEKQRVPLTLYGINMLFNLAWNPTFFLFHAMQTAFWDALGASPSPTTVIAMWTFMPLPSEALGRASRKVSWRHTCMLKFCYELG